MTNLVFHVIKKKASGTSASRRIRKEGLIPCVVYGFKQNHQYSISCTDFLKEYLKGNLLTKIVALKSESEAIQAIVRSVQTDPVNDKPIHIDFQIVDNNTPVKVSINIKILNQDKSPGIKKGGTLNVIYRKIQLHCLSNNIPQHLDVDIGSLDIGGSVRLNNIFLPKSSVSNLKENTTILTIAGRSETDDSAEAEVSTETKKEIDNKQK